MICSIDRFLEFNPNRCGTTTNFADMKIRLSCVRFEEAVVVVTFMIIAIMTEAVPGGAFMASSPPSQSKSRLRLLRHLDSKSPPSSRLPPVRGQAAWHMPQTERE